MPHGIKIVSMDGLYSATYIDGNDIKWFKAGQNTGHEWTIVLQAMYFYSDSNTLKDDIFNWYDLKNKLEKLTR